MIRKPCLMADRRDESKRMRDLVSAPGVAALGHHLDDGAAPRAAPAPPAAPRCRACAARRSSELHLRVYRFFAGGPFWATAAFTSALKARASSFSPSWMSIALRVLPSKLELKRRDGSGILAPRANVSFTTFVYASPVQTIPACDQTGTPAIPFDGFFHFRSSIISGSASRISARMRVRVSSRQSPLAFGFNATV